MAKLTCYSSYQFVDTTNSSMFDKVFLMCNYAVSNVRGVSSRLLVLRVAVVQ